MYQYHVLMLVAG